MKSHKIQHTKQIIYRAYNIIYMQVDRKDRDKQETAHCSGKTVSLVCYTYSHKQFFFIIQSYSKLLYDFLQMNELHNYVVYYDTQLAFPSFI